MRLKLVINGEDKRVRIEPDNASDKKLLEFVVEHQDATLEFARKQGYSYEGPKEVERVDLILQDKGVKPPFDRQALIAELQKNRQTHGIGHGDPYWNSVADIVERYV